MNVMLCRSTCPELSSSSSSRGVSPGCKLRIRRLQTRRACCVSRAHRSRPGADPAGRVVRATLRQRADVAPRGTSNVIGSTERRDRCFEPVPAPPEAAPAPATQRGEQQRDRRAARVGASQLQAQRELVRRPGRRAQAARSERRDRTNATHCVGDEYFARGFEIVRPQRFLADRHTQLRRAARSTCSRITPRTPQNADRASRARRRARRTRCAAVPHTSSPSVSSIRPSRSSDRPTRLRQHLLEPIQMLDAASRALRPRRVSHQRTRMHC